MIDTNKLLLLFKELFEDEFSHLDSENLSIDTVPSWDSLTHLRLMMAIEESFSIELSPEDFQDLTSFPIIEDFLNNK
jgi:acyl carrier protein